LKHEIQSNKPGSKDDIMDGEIETAECAYFIWLRAGCPEGKDLEHWLQAEADLAAKSPPEMVSVSPGTPDSKSEAAAA
jgi:hypothetical protein